MMAALPVMAALAGALLWASGPVAAEDAANTNVIVDESVLDGPAGANGTGTALLPAPAHQPVSRLVTAGQSAVEAATPPETTSEATVSAVPTTPIESVSLEGSEEPDGAFATAPAAGDAAAGEAAPEPPPATAPASSEPAAAAEAPNQPTGTAPAAAQTAESKVPDAGSAAAGEQTAAKPPIDGMVRLTFEPESSVLSDAAKAQLAPLVEKLTGDSLLRVQVLAYAGGDEDASSHARGVSLARALAMRNYLGEQGIAMDRMDIKALGNTAQEEPADRVDLVPLTQ